MRLSQNAARWVTLSAAVTFASAVPVAADLAEVKARGTLRVLAGHDENWFSLEKTGPPGFEREVLEGFARLHGLKFEAVGVERWEEAIPMLRQEPRRPARGRERHSGSAARSIDFTRRAAPGA